MYSQRPAQTYDVEIARKAANVCVAGDRLQCLARTFSHVSRRWTPQLPAPPPMPPNITHQPFKHLRQPHNQPKTRNWNCLTSTPRPVELNAICGGLSLSFADLRLDESARIRRVMMPPRGRRGVGCSSRKSEAAGTVRCTLLLASNSRKWFSGQCISLYILTSCYRAPH